jgi:hypothetical protein
MLAGSEKKKGADSFSHKAVSQFMLKLTSPPPSKSVTSQITIMLDVQCTIMLNVQCAIMLDVQCTIMLNVHCTIMLDVQCKYMYGTRYGIQYR